MGEEGPVLVKYSSAGRCGSAAPPRFIEALLAPAGLIAVGWPESGRIRSKDLIDEGEFASDQTELKLGVGDDYTSLSGYSRPLS